MDIIKIFQKSLLFLSVLSPNTQPVPYKTYVYFSYFPTHCFNTYYDIRVIKKDHYHEVYEKLPSILTDTQAVRKSLLTIKNLILHLIQRDLISKSNCQFYMKIPNVLQLFRPSQPHIIQDKKFMVHKTNSTSQDTKF